MTAAPPPPPRNTTSPPPVPKPRTMTPPPPTSSTSAFPSPNPIPPRTSSTGQTANTSSPSSSAVLRPLSEGDWISPPSSRSPPHRTSSRRRVLPSANILAKMNNNHAATAAAAAATTTSFSSTSTSTIPLPPDPSRFAHDDFNFIGGKKSWAHDKDRVVTGPFDYLNSQRGKDFRSQLIGAFNHWLDVPPRSLEVITKVVGMLHTASLLIDDVEDNSLLRRGLPVAHSLFGVPQTINSANYVYFRALEELQRLGNAAALAVFADELLNLHRGQGMDLFWRDTLTCPTEDEYLEMVGNKTGGLFRLGIKLMQAESRRPVDCVPLVNLIGLIFQIRDDYQNLQSGEYSENKGLAEDLTEGKFSFPVIHSIRSDPRNLQLINILKQRTGDEEVKRYAVKYMEGTGSFEYTRKVLDVLLERARKVAEDIDRGRGEGVNQHIGIILDKMVIGGAGEMHFPAKG